MAATTELEMPPPLIPTPSVEAVYSMPQQKVPEQIDQSEISKQYFHSMPHVRSSLPSTPVAPANHKSFNPFFTRHNPHPSKVHHIKGLLDIPICMVEECDNHHHHYHPGPKFPPNNFVESRIRENSRSQSASGNLFRRSMPVGAINLVGPQSRLIPTDTINGLQYFTGLQNYSFKEKAVPYIGIVPQQEPWRRELESLTTAAFQPLILAELERKMKEGESKENEQNLLEHPGQWMSGKTDAQKNTPPKSSARALYSSSGRLITPAGRKHPGTAGPSGSRSGWLLTPRMSASRQQLVRSATMREANNGKYDHIYNSGQDKQIQIFQMLCGILQSEDPRSVQAWLLSASEREKGLVLDILQSAIKSKEEYYNLHGEKNIKELPNTAMRDQPLQPIQENDIENHKVDRLVVHDDMALPNNVYNHSDLNRPESRFKNNTEATRPPTSPAFKPTKLPSLNQSQDEKVKEVWNPMDSVAN